MIQKHYNPNCEGFNMSLWATSIRGNKKGLFWEKDVADLNNIISYIVRKMPMREPYGGSAAYWELEWVTLAIIEPSSLLQRYVKGQCVQGNLACRFCHTKVSWSNRVHFQVVTGGRLVTSGHGVSKAAFCSRIAAPHIKSLTGNGFCLWHTGTLKETLYRECQ